MNKRANMSAKKRFHFTEQEDKRKESTNRYSRDKQMAPCLSVWSCCGKGDGESGVFPEVCYFNWRVRLELFQSTTTMFKILS